MKTPRLFYYDEGVNAWCPVPFRDEEIPGIIDVGEFLTDGEELQIRLKRFDMTDEEVAALPVE